MSLALKEVLELGGNESDMELLASVNSDDDNEATFTSEKIIEESVLAGLQKLLKELPKTKNDKGKKDDKKTQKSFVVLEDKVQPSVATPSILIAEASVDSTGKLQKLNSKLMKEPLPKNLVFETNSNWYGLQDMPVLHSTGVLSKGDIGLMFERAKDLYDSQVEIYRGKQRF